MMVVSLANSEQSLQTARCGIEREREREQSLQTAPPRFACMHGRGRRGAMAVHWRRAERERVRRERGE
jgi:hypothetical protein